MLSVLRRTGNVLRDLRHAVTGEKACEPGDFRAPTPSAAVEGTEGPALIASAAVSRDSQRVVRVLGNDTFLAR
jgi:hypothetical protein